MSDYIDLVLCKHPESEKTYLFRAPAFSHLKASDAVFVETKKGEWLAEVVSVQTANADDGEYMEFIKNATHATFPLRKVTGKLELKNFDYSEEEKINGHDSDY